MKLKKMKIFYDHQIFCLQKYGGVSRYFCALASRMAQRKSAQVKIVAPLHINRHLRDAAGIKVIGKYLPALPKSRKLMHGINSAVTWAILRQDMPDILHETYYTEFSSLPRNVNTVVTIHDMIPEKFPEFAVGWGKILLAKAAAVRRANHVICVSENTRKDLVEILNVPLQKVSVVHHGSSIGVDSGMSAEAGRRMQKPFLLYVGVRSGYKNFHRLLKAYAQSRLSKGECDLVCFGGGKLSASEKADMAALHLAPDQVRQMEGGDELLSRFYREATALVFPSLYEGFGMPLAEAMALGCPIACSNASSLPEIAGKAAQYFDPYDVDSIARVIEDVVGAVDETQTRVNIGLERARLFSWDACADNTFNIYAALS